MKRLKILSEKNMQDDGLKKATTIGKTSASGSIYLFIGRITATIISAIGVIILGSLILESDYGLFTIALIPLTTIMLFQDWGITSAIARQCAKHRANHNESELRKTIVSGLTFTTIIALLLTAISILTANFIASAFLNQPSSAFLMIIASASILSTAIFGISQSVFVGFERMKIVSFISILQAIEQCVIAPVLVWLGYGALGAMIGFILPSIAGGIISITILYFSIYKKLPSNNSRSLDFFKTLKPLLYFGLPLAIGGILGGLLGQFNFFVMARYVQDLTLIGNYKIASNFTVLLTFITVPITTVLFPAFSKVDPKKEINIVKMLFSSSVKYTALLLIPATMILVILSPSIIGALYGSKWGFAPEYLVYLIIGNFFACLGLVTIPPFFSALGETKLILKMNILYLAIGVPLAFVLIPWAGIVGMIFDLLIAGTPGVFIYLYVAWKKFGSTINYGSSAKILLSSLLSGAVVYLFLSTFVLSYWIELTIGFILFLALYFLSISLIGAIDQNDVTNLRVMFSSLGAISGILEIPLKLIEILLKQFNLAKSKKIDS